MPVVLAATHSGCLAFTDSGEHETELAGCEVSALAPAKDGACLAVVDGCEVWRRVGSGTWSKVASTDICLQSIVEVEGDIFAGGSDEAAIVRITNGGEPERLVGFDAVEGRSEWFAGGPPLGVRSLTATSDGAAILAAVHVGGIPRSEDRGESWTPTVPIVFDIHEVQAHPTLPNIVLAAAAVGLCISVDGGKSWGVLSEGLELTNSLAAAMLEEEALLSIQDGPFASRSQVWRWPIGGTHLEQVRDGLPEWLEGKVDTSHIGAGAGRAAIVDGGGNLWLTKAGSRNWQRIATGLGYVFGVVTLP